METQKFAGKRVLVTGACSGIGRAIAIKLQSLGAHVLALSFDQTNLDSLKSRHPDIETICVNLKNWDETRKAIKTVLPVDLLVNNAGITKLASVLEATPEDFDALMSVNLKAAMNISQVVCQDLIRTGKKGNIVNMASQASLRPLKDHVIYSSSKAGLDMMTRCFAYEMGPHGIRVNSINPTVVMTEMGRKAWADPVKAKAMLDRIPQGRFAEVEEIVNVVVFLLSDCSDMINGHNLPVDGGFVGC